MRNSTLFLLLAPTLALPGLYTLAGVQPTYLIPLVLALATAALYAILNPPHALRYVLATPTPTAALLIALAAMALTHHQPIPTFLPSGWNLLLSPLTHFGLTPLLTPFVLAFTVFTMRTLNHPWTQINRFTLTLFTCLLMWPDGAADLPALGLLILSLTLLLTRQRIQWPELAALILLLATAATARSVFVYLPLLMGFALFAVWPKRGLTVALAGTAFTMALNPAFPTFPIHNFANPAVLTATILLLIVMLQSLYHWRWWPAPQHAAWGLGAPALVIALANLSETSSIAAWQGAIYLTPALPVVIYSLLRPTFKHT